MLRIRIRWVEPTYEAALDDGGEWPPHPARLFCALVSTAQSPADDAALRWLEEQPPPVVTAPRASPSALTAYVPTNNIAKTTKSNRVARTNSQRSWQRQHLDGNHALMVWPTAPPAAVLSSLAELGRRVGYLGRASSQAILDVEDWQEPAVQAAAGESWCPHSEGSVRVRVPYPGYLRALRAAFEDGEPARSVNRWQTYASPLEAARATNGPNPRPSSGASSDLVIRAFEAGRSVDGRLAVRTAQAFRARLLEVLGREHPPEELSAVHGHHDGSVRQCSFVALPFVGAPRATGQILGVGVAIPVDLPQGVRRSLLKALGMGRSEQAVTDFYIPGLFGEVGTRDIKLGEPDGRRTVSPQTWTGGTRGSRSWSTAYPIVLDRFPGPRPDPEAVAGQLGDSCVYAGLPRPAVVELLPVAPLAGTPVLRPEDRRRRSDDPARPAVHARLEFDLPIAGPVLLGHLRHVGLGLLRPTLDVP